MVKKILFILVLLLLFYSCSDEKELSTLDLFLEEIKIEPQLFNVSTDSIIQIKGKKGTTLIINPKNIDFQNGEIPKEIRIEFIELTTTEELVRHNVQTISNDKWLISGGSFKISLFHRDKPLSLKKGKTISAVFPKIRDEKMQLFYGKRNELRAMNWEPEQQFFEEEMYYGILERNEITMDTERNSGYKTVGYFIENILIDSLGYSNMESHKEFFDERGVDSVLINQDTIKGYLLIAPPEYFNYDLIGDEINNAALNDSSLFNSSELLYTNVYRAIEINKLGWINIDTFYPDNEDRVSYEVTFDIPIKHVKLYVVDKTNNTVVNIYSTNYKYIVELPIEKEFTFIALGSNGEELYSSKKTVKIQDSKILKMNMEIVTENNFSDIFK